MGAISNVPVSIDSSPILPFNRMSSTTIHQPPVPLRKLIHGHQAGNREANYHNGPMPIIDRRQSPFSSGVRSSPSVEGVTGEQHLSLALSRMIEEKAEAEKQHNDLIARCHALQAELEASERSRKGLKDDLAQSRLSSSLVNDRFTKLENFIAKVNTNLQNIDGRTTEMSSAFKEQNSNGQLVVTALAEASNEINKFEDKLNEYIKIEKQNNESLLAKEKGKSLF